MDNANLRPALLLMAQCHHSLAHQNRGDPEFKEGSDQHFVKLLDWLRETYGPNTPTMDAILQSSERDPYRNGTGLFETHSSAQARADALEAENAKLRENQKALQAELATARLQRDDAQALLREKDGKLTRAIEDGRVEAARAARETDTRRRLEEKFAQERKVWEVRTVELREEGARYAVRDLEAILSLSSRRPLVSLEATRNFCEARGRTDKPPLP